MRSCLAVRNLEKAKTYINILRHSGQKVNTATLSKYILLCAFCSDKIPDKSEIETLCNELKSHSHYLNAPSLESIIMGLSVTENWKQGLQLLTSHEEAQTALTLNAYVSKLVLGDDLQSAITWMECLMKKDRPFYDATYEQWVEKCSSSPEAWVKLTDFLVRHQVLIPRSIAEKLKEMLEKKTTGSFVGQFTDVEKRTGACRTCRRTMKNASITRDQFQALKDNMLEKVLCGADVYKGSHPEELHKFYKFIENNAPYDVVIDGLNVAYFAGHGNSRAANLKKIEGINAVIKYLHDKQFKRILVLGRKHMLGWSPPVIKEIKQRAHMFLTEDLSKDDPFLLYAALQDPNTKFVSDDLFRDHLFRLADYDLQSTFRQWQRNAQLQIVAIRHDGSVAMQHPLRYQTVTQLNDGCWHIPYDDGKPRFSYQLPNTWLCLQPKS
nr:EOG090X0CGF [Moina brachiata]